MQTIDEVKKHCREVGEGRRDDANICSEQMHVSMRSQGGQVMMKKIAMTLSLFACCICFSSHARITSEDLIVLSLPDVVRLGLAPSKGVIYEITSNWRVPAAGFGRGNEILIQGDGYRALIGTRHEVAERECVPPGYYRYVGNVAYSDSKIANETRLRKFVELSERESEQVREALAEQAALVEQKLFEERRQRAVELALKGIDELTEDENVINKAYDQVLTIYDEAYRVNKKEREAESAAKDMGARLLGLLADELRQERERMARERLEWEKAHPKEAAEERRLEAERLARLAKEKLEAEIARTKESINQIVRCVEEASGRGSDKRIPKDVKMLRMLIGARMPRMIDAWGGAIEYIPNPNGYVVISYGPDREKCSKDDIVVHGEGHVCVPSVGPSGITDVVGAVEKYEGSVVPSVCGFKFGSKATMRRGEYVLEEVRKLDRPFRCCSEAILRYAGKTDPRLVDIVLVGRIPLSQSGAARILQEGPICRKLIEKKYGIKLRLALAGEYTIANYSDRNSIQVELRNDGTDIIGEEECAMISIGFRDMFLMALIEKRDADIEAATSKQKKEAERDTVVPDIPRPSQTDLDAL